MAFKRKLPGRTAGAVITNLLLAAIAAGLFLALNSPGAQTLAASSPAGPGTVYRGRDERRVSLVCVVSWNASACESILGTLSRQGGSMTFAVGAEFAAENPELLRKMRETGQDIALCCEGDAKNDLGAAAEELRRTLQLVSGACGAAPRAFVCGKDTDAAACRAARALGLTVVAGSCDLVCVRGTAAEIAARAKTVRGGDVAVCAPTAAFAEALPRILEYYSGMGLTAASLSGTIYD